MKKLIGGKVYFSGSDVTADLTKTEMENAPVSFSNKGARMMRTKAGDILIFGGTNMSVIKPVWLEMDDDDEPNAIVIKKGTAVGMTELDPEVVAQVEALPRMDEQVETPKKKTQEEIIAEMTAKSDCDHKGKLELYIQHTAKGIRYFPRCSFCGRRERYVSESKIVEGKYAGTPNEIWTEEHIAHAKPWIED
jgi:hypothetical protein